jgi:hypothetical protein
MLVTAIAATVTCAAAAPSRITEVVRDTDTVRLAGNTPGIVSPSADLGPVPENQKLGHMFILLQPGAGTGARRLQ